MNTLIVLNPLWGGRIRGVINTLFAIFVIVLKFWPELAHQGWAGTVVTVYAFIVTVIQLLTHGTTIGNDVEPK